MFSAVYAYLFFITIKEFKRDITSTTDYGRNFKEEIISSIVSFIDNNLTYLDNLDQKYNDDFKQIFIDSMLFRAKPNEFFIDDIIRGNIDGVNMTFFEADAQYLRGRHHHVVFKGLIFTAEFNKNFDGKIVILPNIIRGKFKTAMAKLYSWGTHLGELVLMEDPEFEKQLMVFGNVQIGARYVLSPSLMRRIIDFKNKTGKDISVSVINSKVYIAIPYNKYLFEPKLFSASLSFKDASEYFKDISLAIDIVRDLKLNVKI